MDINCSFNSAYAAFHLFFLIHLRAFLLRHRTNARALPFFDFSLRSAHSLSWTEGYIKIDATKKPSTVSGFLVVATTREVAEAQLRSLLQQPGLLETRASHLVPLSPDLRTECASECAPPTFEPQS
jgi:hypothetical protein